MKTVLALLFAGWVSTVLAETPARFLPADILVDTGGAPLAAWQLEVLYPAGQVTIVGLEGGAGEPFPASRPPRYDRRGLADGRIILADFTTSNVEAKGRFRIARLHLRVTGEAQPDLHLRLMAAAQPGGEPIDAVLSIEVNEEDQP